MQHDSIMSDEIFEALIPIVAIVSVFLLVLMLLQVNLYFTVIVPERKQWQSVINYFITTKGMLTATLVKLAINREDDRPVSFIALMNNVRNVYTPIDAN